MTGTAGIIMWLMMGLMIATMASGAITWAKQRLRRQGAQRSQLQAPRGRCAPPLAPPAVTRQCMTPCPPGSRHTRPYTPAAGRLCEHTLGGGGLTSRAIVTSAAVGRKTMVCDSAARR